MIKSLQDVYRCKMDIWKTFWVIHGWSNMVASIKFTFCNICAVVNMNKSPSLRSYKSSTKWLGQPWLIIVPRWPIVRNVRLPIPLANEPFAIKGTFLSNCSLLKILLRYIRIWRISASRIWLHKMHKKHILKFKRRPKITVKKSL